MKNLKKIVFGLLAMLVMVTSVNAITVDELVADENSGVIKTKDGVYQLTKKLEADIEINKGQSITLDLHGKGLTNKEVHNSAIFVRRGGELLLTDSTENVGIIQNNANSEANDSTYATVINNAGKLVMENVKLLVIKGESGKTGSAIYNTGDLTINSGLVRTDSTYAWGIVNDGTTTINGGNIIQKNDFSVINNSRELYINGGIIRCQNTTCNSLITNEDGSYLKISAGENGMPTITPRKDNNNYKLFHNGTSNVEIEISAGKFPADLTSETVIDNNSKTISDFIADEYEIVSGVVATDADLTALNEAIENAEAVMAEEDYATKYTDASKAVLDAALEAARPALKYRSDKQAEIDSLAEELNNAIAALKTQNKVKVELVLDEVGDAHSILPDELILEAGKEYRLSQILHLDLLDIVAYKDYTAYYTVSYGDTVEHFTSSVGGKIPGAIVPSPIVLTKATYSDSFVMPDEEITITLEIKKTEVSEEVTSYKVEVVAPENGKLTVDKTEAKEGDVVTVTVKADDGYKVAKVLVNGEEITADEEGNYSFIMPAEDVTVSAEFEKVPVNNPTGDGKETDTNKEEENNNNNTGSTSENQKPADDESQKENPSTLDSIVSIVTLAISSLGTAGYSIKKFIRK